MKILFDLTATQPDSKVINHGGGEYTKAVFVELTNTAPDSVIALYNKNFELDYEITELIRKHSLEKILSNDIDLVRRFIVEKGINIFYTGLAKPEHLRLFDLQSETFKVIITIHGLRSLELPSDKYEWYYCGSVKSRIKLIYKSLFPLIYKNSVSRHYFKFLQAHKIITVSHHSKKSILTFFPEIPEERISVFYSPLIDYSKSINSTDNNISKLSLSNRKYFLLLSASIWTKNCYRAIKAFDKLLSENQKCKEYKMLITGINNQFFEIKNRDNFIFTDYLERKSLEELFKNTLALVYPTLNEGFGYPPLEAFKYGVPVFASEIGSVREVCGEAAYYFDPENIPEIRNCLLSAIELSDLFSESNIQIRYNRYKMIKDRQKADLTKMISLLLEC
jgi:glycosyltransferase involved in cell wall biosynthesis